jgi:hypothetical protein
MHDDPPARASLAQVLGQLRGAVEHQPLITDQLCPGQRRGVGAVVFRVDTVQQRAVGGGRDHIARVNLTDQRLGLGPPRACRTQQRGTEALLRSR